MKAVVNRIIPFSSVDGPGNRTAIFLQGCNIDCKYCHNPETRKLCVQCGVCVKQCPVGALSVGEDGKVVFEPSKCVQCDTCIHVCPHDSSPRTCEMTPEEVYARVKKQIPFIRGISVSGGECMLWPEFLTELFRLARKDSLGTLIDSNGMIPFEQYPELMEVSDGVMLDIKAFEASEHVKVAGVTNEMVLKNADYLQEPESFMRCGPSLCRIFTTPKKASGRWEISWHRIWNTEISGLRSLPIVRWACGSSIPISRCRTRSTWHIWQIY